MLAEFGAAALLPPTRISHAEAYDAITLRAVQRARFTGLVVKRAMGFEPTTLSLGSGIQGAWLSKNRTAKPNSTRSNPLETAPGGWSLAHNWRAGHL
jgi:hypothetical protein